MLECGIIGIGNAGSQVAALGNELENYEAVAINTSENDLATIQSSIIKFSIGDLRGAGKNRNEAKAALKPKIKEILEKDTFNEFMSEKDVVFVISSTGGGTGSGITPLFSQILKKTYPKAHIIIIGILPSLREAYSTQINTLEYMDELYTKVERPTYMIYDNSKIKNKPSNIVMDTVNAAIVQDIKILVGTYNITTKYSSIDEKDNMMVLTTPGRIVVGSYMDIKEKDLEEKSIEKRIYDDIRLGAHAELQSDRVIKRSGIITNISNQIMTKFDDNLAELQVAMGSTVEEFSHIAIVTEKAIPSNVFYIGAGLSSIVDRIDKINERVDEINLAHQDEDSSINEALSIIDVDESNKKRLYEEKKVDATVDVSAIFDSFS